MASFEEHINNFVEGVFKIWLGKNGYEKLQYERLLNRGRGVMLQHPMPEQLDYYANELAGKVDDATFQYGKLAHDLFVQNIPTIEFGRSYSLTAYAAVSVEIEDYIKFCGPRNGPQRLADTISELFKIYSEPSTEKYVVTKPTKIDLATATRAHKFVSKNAHVLYKTNAILRQRSSADLNGDIEDFRGHFNGTPLMHATHHNRGYNLPNRFEHTYILGGSGHGKTQLIQSMIAKDLEEDCCIIVIDSQKQLISQLVNLDIPIEDITWISPRNSLALNIFDVDYQAIKNQDEVINTVVELLEFALGSLMGAPLTPKQSIIFQFAIRLNIAIPNGNIDTFMHVLEDNKYHDYADVIETLDPMAQRFFRTQYGDRQFNETKKEITWRIWALLKNPVFARMFSAKTNPIDLLAEMDEAKLVLIDTDKKLLTKDCKLFGRLFISMILQAAQARFSGAKRSVYLYIDEAHEYFDDNIAEMMDQARKAKIGVILAHQRLSHFPTPAMQEAVFANTATKIIGGVTIKSARVIAPEINADAEQLSSQPKFTFSLYLKGIGNFDHKITYGVMEAMPKRSDFEAMRREMIENYGNQSMQTEPEETVAMSENEAQDIEPSDTL